MSEESARYAPGRVRDALLQVLTLTSESLSVKQIEERVCKVIGPTPTSSVRSYLRLNTPNLFTREERGVYRVAHKYFGGVQRESMLAPKWEEPVAIGRTQLLHADRFDWLERQEDNSINAVVTDPPYGLHEYAPEQQLKLHSGERAGYGESRRLSMAISDRHCLVSRLYLILRSRSCARSSSFGRGSCYPSSSLALMSSWHPTHCSHLSYREPWQTLDSNVEEKS
ncbi:MAG: hypothetical protein Q7O66_18675 [Dehalococcoidia bacterium]|nr:hypothetical protein [Dehalococcoidia bacterium]